MVKMFWRNVSNIILLKSLLLNFVFGDTRSVLRVYKEEFIKNKGCCTPPFPPEDFKNCVTHKRRSLPASSLGFKSISCQCHVTQVTTEVPTGTRWVQTFRQCLLTGDEHKEPTPEDKKLDLFKACKEGNLDAVKTIISRQPEKLDTKDDEDHTPLMNSAWNGQAGVFTYLACHTCRWTDLNKYNDTMLHIAVVGGSADIVKRVLSLRLFNIDRKGEDGRTPFLLALRFGHTDIARLLVQAGSNLMLSDRKQHNMLHLGSKSKKMETLKFVLGLGILSLESRQIDGLTPLLVAAMRGFIEGCKYLIQQGANVTAVDNEGNSLLHQVLKIKKKYKVRLTIMQYFLSKNYVSKDIKGEFQQTPLLQAAWQGDVDLFELLVFTGCDLYSVDADGNSILHVATQHGKYEMVEYILDGGYVLPSTRGQYGITALMAAAYHGYIKIFKLLHREGSNITSVDYVKRSVLHWACILGKVKMIKYILSLKKVQIDAKDNLGYTPLMYAVRNGRVPAFKLMRGKDCSTKLRNKEGNTILHLAVISKNTKMVLLLKDLEIAQHYLHEQNAQGNTPKQIAEKSGFKEMLDLLIMFEG